MDSWPYHYDLPVWSTVRYYFDKWKRDGIKERINEALRRASPVRGSRRRDLAPVT